MKLYNDEAYSIENIIHKAAESGWNSMQFNDMALNGRDLLGRAKEVFPLDLIMVLRVWEGH